MYYRKFFFKLFLYSFIFALNLQAYDYSSLIKDLNSSIKNTKIRFSYLKPNNTTNLEKNSEFLKLQNNIRNNFISDLENQLNNIQNKKGFFFNKEEFKKMKEISLKNIQMMKKVKNKGINFLFFLTSKSVPNQVISNWMLEIAILEKAGVNIYPIVYTRGFGKNFQDYFFDLANTMKKNIPLEYVSYVKKNFRFKLGPQFFKYLKLKKVPAIVLANCNNFYPMVKDCKIKYLMRGDMHLDYFFDKISEIDNNPVYKKYYRILIANKIENYNQNNK